MSSVSSHKVSKSSETECKVGWYRGLYEGQREYKVSPEILKISYIFSKYNSFVYP